MEGIGKLPRANIEDRFLEWSIEVKIHDYKGKNWIFAVPKTQCLIRPKESKIIQKENKLIISIAKNVNADSWSTLHKVRCIGEKND
jgi:calcyclin binding protein